MIKAELIAHSRHSNKELISIETYAPKFLDAEIEKHCAIASNSSSDRAIPIAKMIKQHPYLPLDVRKKEKGMQGYENVDAESLHKYHKELMHLYDTACDTMEYLDTYHKIHKQHLNRLLLPFSMQKKIMTASRYDWEYFLNLRNHPAADPSVQILAKEIQAILTANTIDDAEALNAGEWHLPYITANEKKGIPTSTLLKVSAARCARNSYKTHEGKLSGLMDDEELFNTLVKSEPKHLSPLDHQGKVPLRNHNRVTENFVINRPALWERGVTHINRDSTIGSGKFKSWISYRHYFLQ